MSQAGSNPIVGNDEDSKPVFFHDAIGHDTVQIHDNLELFANKTRKDWLDSLLKNGVEGLCFLGMDEMFGSERGGYGNNPVQAGDDGVHVEHWKSLGEAASFYGLPAPLSDNTEAGLFFARDYLPAASLLSSIMCAVAEIFTEDNLRAVLTPPALILGGPGGFCNHYLIDDLSSYGTPNRAYVADSNSIFRCFLFLGGTLTTCEADEDVSISDIYMKRAYASVICHAGAAASGLYTTGGEKIMTMKDVCEELKYKHRVYPGDMIVAKASFPWTVELPILARMQNARFISWLVIPCRPEQHQIELPPPHPFVRVAKFIEDVVHTDSNAQTYYEEEMRSLKFDGEAVKGIRLTVEMERCRLQPGWYGRESSGVTGQCYSVLSREFNIHRPSAYIMSKMRRSIDVSGTDRRRTSVGNTNAGVAGLDDQEFEQNPPGQDSDAAQKEAEKDTDAVIEQEKNDAKLAGPELTAAQKGIAEDTEAMNEAQQEKLDGGPDRPQSTAALKGVEKDTEAVTEAQQKETDVEQVKTDAEQAGPAAPGVEAAAEEVQKRPEICSDDTGKNHEATDNPGKGPDKKGLKTDIAKDPPEEKVTDKTPDHVENENEQNTDALKKTGRELLETKARLILHGTEDSLSTSPIRRRISSHIRTARSSVGSTDLHSMKLDDMDDIAAPLGALKDLHAAEQTAGSASLTNRLSQSLQSQSPKQTSVEGNDSTGVKNPPSTGNGKESAEGPPRDRGKGRHGHQEPEVGAERTEAELEVEDKQAVPAIEEGSGVTNGKRGRGGGRPRSGRGGGAPRNIPRTSPVVTRARRKQLDNTQN